jgi:AP-3 complex subunit beta
MSTTSSSSASNIQIRSLVSLYILRQAAIEPDLALLAVNMYQKDLRDPNPVVRALAIRTLAGMELESIVTLVLMSLKTASRDTNWFVRRTVAEALERVYV